MVHHSSPTAARPVATAGPSFGVLQQATLRKKPSFKLLRLILWRRRCYKSSRVQYQPEAVLFKIFEKFTSRMLGTLACSAFVSTCPCINHPAHCSMHGGSISSISSIRSSGAHLLLQERRRKQCLPGTGCRVHQRSSSTRHDGPHMLSWLYAPAHSDGTSGCSSTARSWSAVPHGSSNPPTGRRKRRRRGHATVGGQDGLYQTPETRFTGQHAILHDHFHGRTYRGLGGTDDLYPEHQVIRSL